MKKIIWLASWYPNQSEPFSGDFIKRQAEAVSELQPLTVIYVGKYLPNEEVPLTTTITADQNLSEHIVYYSDSGSSKTLISRTRSLWNYFKLNLGIFQAFREKYGLPDLVHVQVAMKAGLVALYLKKRYKINYVLTEHWTGYYKESGDSLFRKSFLQKYLTRSILKNASGLLPVSEALGNQISRFWINRRFQKIPNVVDTRLFFPTSIQPQKFRFIHVSNLNLQKNAEGIIYVFAELIKQYPHAELVLVGPLSHSIRILIDKMDPQGKNIISTGEISYAQVGVQLRKASVFVLFSFYENMPCAMLEALCTGLPCIVSRVGGIPEVINNSNGLFVQPGKEDELLEAMKTMIREYQNYNRNQISETAANLFSYETVGKNIVDVYDELLSEK